MTLNPKFSLKYIDKSDIIPLTNEAKKYLIKLLNVFWITFIGIMKKVLSGEI